MALKRKYSNQIHLISQTIFKAIISVGKTRFNDSLIGRENNRQSTVGNLQSAIYRL